MSKELRVNLAVAYISLTAVTLITGFIGWVTHHLDVGSVVLLCIFFAAFSTLYTWFSVWDERKTQASLLELRGDLGALGLHILKQKSDTYDVVDGDSDAPGHTIVTEGLSLSELEAFRDGVFTGIDMSQEQDSDADTDMEARSARQAVQHEEAP